jgi:hypothetical protein
VSIRPEWIAREDNTYADKLSKLWEKWYKLTPAATQRTNALAAAFSDEKGAVPAVLSIPFNQIGNALDRHRTTTKRTTLIYPVWPGQRWWTDLQSATNASATITLGTSTDVLQRMHTDSAELCFPSWTIRASVLLH